MYLGWTADTNKLVTALGVDGGDSTRMHFSITKYVRIYNELALSIIKNFQLKNFQ